MALAKMLTVLLLFVSFASHATAAEELSAKKSVAEWIDDLASGDQAVRSAASEELDRYYDYLVYPLQYQPEVDVLATRDQLVSQVKSRSAVLNEILRGKHEESVITAAHLLALLGTDAAPAERMLVEIVQSSTRSTNLRFAAALALLHIMPMDKPALPLLVEAFRKAPLGDYDERDNDSVLGAGVSSVFVILCLIQSGRTIVETPSLAELATDKYPKLYRAIALCTLCEFGEDAKAAIPTLRKLLADEDPALRQGAAGALLCAQGNLEELPEILKALQLSDKERAEFVQTVSAKLDDSRIVEIFHTERGSENTDDDLFRRVRDDHYIPALIWELRNGKPFQQRQAIRRLAKMGSVAQPAIPELRSAAAKGEKTTQELAEAAIETISSSKNELKVGDQE
ncbi:MAG TPA: HEAT repeat domain-containing protein [Schlesneria sp.]|jgi:hypothetical protein